MPKEATTASQSSDAPTRGAKARAISRVTVPYLAAALFAASAMGWYFFAFVPAKLDYFFGLRFRALAVAAAQVKSKAENLSRSLESAVNPAASTDLESAQEYLSLLVPEIQIASAPADDTVLRLSARDVDAIVRWDDVVRAAAPVSTRDFDDLILADSEGTTLWQRERTTPRIGNLKTLLSVEPEPSGWFTTSWQRHRTTVKKDQDAMQPIPVLAPIDFGGVSSYVFVQSVTPVAKGIGNKPPLYLAGIVSRRVVERQAMHIPVHWILLCVLPVALLFLALPFIKLATLTPKERYSFIDVALLGVAAVAAANLGAAIPFGPAVVDSSVDATLGRLAGEIERRFAAETSKVLDLAGALQANGAKLSGQGTCHGTDARETSKPPASPPQKEKQESTPMGCELWQALDALKGAETDDAALARVTPGSVELDVVAWLDRRGQQVKKWTTKSVATAPVSHAPYAHFRDLVSGKTWTLANPSLNRMPFTLEPLRTPTTAQMGFVFAVRTSDVEQPYFILNVRPQSVVGSPHASRLWIRRDERGRRRLVPFGRGAEPGGRLPGRGQLSRRGARVGRRRSDGDVERGLPRTAAPAALAGDAPVREQPMANRHVSAVGAGLQSAVGHSLDGGAELRRADGGPVGLLAARGGHVASTPRHLARSAVCDHQGCLAPGCARRDIGGADWLDVLSERQPAPERALPLVSRYSLSSQSSVRSPPGAGSATKSRRASDGTTPKSSFSSRSWASRLVSALRALPAACRTRRAWRAGWSPRAIGGMRGASECWIE